MDLTSYLILVGVIVVYFGILEFVPTPWGTAVHVAVWAGIPLATLIVLLALGR